MTESNERNPYAPPKATLRDAPERAGQPKLVRIAVAILWAELGLGVISTLIELGWTNTPSPAELPFQLAWNGAWVALAAFLNFKIAAGHSWARTLTLVLGVLSVIGLIGIVVKEGLPATELAFDTIGIVLDAVALVMLYQRASREWFDGLD